ncbi:MAG: hypothetical protein HAW63_05320 [Bdellovibrionaceae bacterium]|nr:hypothetical protein [Pseudobdellovibrionaceae bacterium]
MRALSLLEVGQLLKKLNSLKGSRVQNLSYQGNQLLLELWSSALKKQYLFFDINKISPLCFDFADKPRLDSNVFKSPVGLFCKSHLKGKKLSAIAMPFSSRRILQFNFESFLLEFCMIPHFANIEVSYDDKSLCWYKVKKEGEDSCSTDITSSRGLLNIKKEWLDSRQVQRDSKEKSKNKQNALIHFFSNKTKRTQRALLKNEKDIEGRLRAGAMAKEIAFKLRTTSSLTNLSSDQIIHIKEKQSWAWNMDDQFSKYKKITHKLKQTQKRQKDLQKDLDTLVTLIETPFLKNLNIVIDISLLKKCKVEKIPQLLLGGEPSYELAFKKGVFKKFIPAQGQKPSLEKTVLFPGVAKRSLLLDSGVAVVAGKNAKANVDLLRQARPWHIWVHLRDYPSSHAIILTTKAQKITDKEIIMVGRWLAEFSLKKGHLAEIKLDAMYTQCRFVKSIKGDSLGRVSYKNEKTILL